MYWFHKQGISVLAKPIPTSKTEPCTLGVSSSKSVQCTFKLFDLRFSRCWLWDVTPCSLVETALYAACVLGLFFDHEDEGSTFLWNTGTLTTRRHVPEDTLQYLHWLRTRHKQCSGWTSGHCCMSAFCPGKDVQRQTVIIIIIIVVVNVVVVLQNNLI
jgi:hypothetical protein